MLELPEGGALQWTVGVALVAICWALIKNAFVALAKPEGLSNRSDDEGEFDDARGDPYAGLDVPPQPHLEIALSPPCGLHCSNSPEPYTFENDLCYGKYFFFHPPTTSNAAARRTSDGLDFAEYFRGKTRIWELRVEFRFKTPPSAEEELFFGTELEAYVPLSAAAKQVLGLAVGTVRAAVGGLYHTPGDDPSRAHTEVERPCFMLPLWAFDQFIITPEGEKPPSLTDPAFASFGSRRYRRVAAYAKEIAELRNDIRVGSTYTFAFWGSSRFGDVINWRLLGIPMAGPIDLSKFVGKPPVYCALYALAPGEQGERRHLQSRKRYYFRAAIWSSLHRPERSRIEALTGEQLVRHSSSSDLSDPEVASRGPVLFKGKGKACTKTLRRRFGRWVARAAMTCCTSRPR